MDEEIQSLVTAKEAGHTVVDVEGLVNSMQGKLESISKSPPFHICLVPATIRKHNHVYYNPKIVSIGPFHRRRKNLREMEEHKWRYLQNVLHNCTRKPTLEECVQKLTRIAEDARKCYSGNIKPDDEFVKMMLLDGSFIIQLLLRPNENDPIHRNIWMVHAIADDMLLLENQLPFCVLECLAECFGDDANALKEEALVFFSKYLPDTLNFKEGAKNYDTSGNIHHLLHLVHQSLKPAPPTTKKHQVDSIPTATELEEAGVVFERNEGESFLDVTFKKGICKMGVMRLPRLQITDDTNSLFRNIIAFEQCFPDSGGAFTSYCIFMDLLVNTPRDVQILKKSRIIENHLGSDEEVALLFNQLCKEIAGSLDTGSVAQACVDVNHYAAKRRHKWRAILKRDYFSNPWAFISLIAAIYVIFLTSVQTYYAAF